MHHFLLSPHCKVQISTDNLSKAKLFRLSLSRSSFSSESSPSVSSMSKFLLTVYSRKSRFPLPYSSKFFNPLPTAQFQACTPHIFRYLLEQHITSDAKICISFLLPHNKLPQTLWTKVLRQNIYYLTVSGGQESGYSLAGPSTQGLTRPKSWFQLRL